MNVRLLACIWFACSWVTAKEVLAGEGSHGVQVCAPIVRLQGRMVRVDLYLPEDARGAPVAILAHGFTREPKYFRAWGQVLAENGIVTAIPNLPFFADHAGNARGMVELLKLLQKGGLGQGEIPSQKAAFLGHSAGGLSALLAAKELGDQVQCWIGLDPVDSWNLGLTSAKTLRVPSLMFFTEPGLFNRRCKALNWVPAYGGPLWALHVEGATHSEPEKPTSLLSRLFVGEWSEARHSIFEEYTLAMLRCALFGDAKGERQLRLSWRDKRVTVLKKGVEGNPK
jgi:pimeloyl-ACP methyl ester carboxylesterase